MSWSWQAILGVAALLRRRFWAFAVLVGGYELLELPLRILAVKEAQSSQFYEVLLALVECLLSPLLLVALFMLAEAREGERLEFSAFWRRGLALWRRIFILMMTLGLIALVAFGLAAAVLFAVFYLLGWREVALLLVAVIPAAYFLARYQFAQVLIFEEGLEPYTARAASIDATKGKRALLFLSLLVFFLPGELSAFMNAKYDVFAGLIGTDGGSIVLESLLSMWQSIGTLWTYFAYLSTAQRKTTS